MVSVSSVWYRFLKAFLVGGSNGIVYIFEKKNDMDPKNPFIRSDKKF